MVSNAARLQLDSSRIVAFGGSAGAVTVAQLLHALPEGTPMPAPVPPPAVEEPPAPLPPPPPEIDEATTADGAAAPPSRILAGNAIGAMDAADDDGVGWLDADDVQAAVATGELAFDGRRCADDAMPPCACACATADYAMQNVLLQLGLRLVGVDGLVIAPFISISSNASDIIDVGYFKKIDSIEILVI